MKLFSMDGPVVVTMTKVADLLWLNLLYIICCIPIVTIGAATSALYYVTLKMVRNEEGYVTRAFFKSFKDNFKQATVIWIIYGIIFGVAASDLIFVNAGFLKGMFNSGDSVSNVVKISVLVMAFVLFASFLYVFPLLAQFDNTTKNTVKNSFFMALSHMPQTLIMLALNLIPLYMMATNIKACVLVIIIFAGLAYLNSLFFNRIFDRYIPKNDDSIEEMTTE